MIFLDTYKKNEYFKTGQVAERLGLKKSDEVSALIRLNKFPNAFRVNNRWRITLEDIEEYERQMQKNNTDHCLSVRETVARLGYKTGTSVMDLIEKSILPNAIKLNGIWWIPIEDIESIEEKRLGTLNATQTAQRLDFKSSSAITVLINKNEFPNAFKDFSGAWRIPHSDIIMYEEKMNKEGTVDIKEATRLLGFKSTESVIQLVRSKHFFGVYKVKGAFRIPIKDIEEYIEILKKVEGCLDTKQAAERLGYKAAFSIIQLIEKSILPNAFKVNSKWWVPEEDIEVIEKMKLEHLDVSGVAQKLDVKSERVTQMIRNNVFPNAFTDVLGVLRIPFEDVVEFQMKKTKEEFQMKKISTESVDVAEAARLLGYKNKGTILKYLHNDNFRNAYKYRRKWRIPLKDIEAFRLNFTEIKKSTVKKKILAGDNPETQNSLDIIEIQEELKLNASQILYLINKKLLPNAFKFKRKWWITRRDLEIYQKETKQNRELIKSSLSVEEVADRLGYRDKGTLSTMITKQNKLPNAIKVGASWRIPITDVEKFEKVLAKKNQKIEYTTGVAYTELKDFVEAIEISEQLRKTKELYLQYCLLQINNMGGSTRYKRDRILLFKRLYEKLIDMITHEIFLINTDEISEMLSEKSLIRKDEKKILILFLKYAYNQKDIEPDQQYSLTTIGKNTKDKEIYSPAEFHEIYQYVKDTCTHTPSALKDRSYANMWVYTILLLTDFIRGQDLIVNTPKVDTEAVNIDSIDWFIGNKISDAQAQSIINQLYIHFRYKRASKTDELLTFIVAPDLVVPLATALTISELHRRFESSEVQLGTFLEGKFNTVKTSGRRKHKNFFEKMRNSSEFKFSSLKMNRSVATYLFYSITEEEGRDSDLALHLTQVSRSHKSSDSTSTYIQATNKDGTINRVSYNLFKRGHFGWLYNYLILYVSQFEGRQDTLEQRSKLIEEVRGEISPLDLESVAKFVNNSLAPMPLNRSSDSMDNFLQNIYKKRQTVISKLSGYSKEEIREIITKLANGDLPSKNEHAQCLVFPNCKNPKLTNCFSCEYVIPGNLMLIQLNEELNRVIENIENATNVVIIQRESKFLMHALFIWKESRIEFGDEKVNAYIVAEEKWRNIEKVAHKLNVE